MLPLSFKQTFLDKSSTIYLGNWQIIWQIEHNLYTYINLTYKRNNYKSQFILISIKLLFEKFLSQG